MNASTAIRRLRSAASLIASTSGADRASGFSQRTCLPASSARIVQVGGARSAGRCRRRRSPDRPGAPRSRRGRVRHRGGGKGGGSLRVPAGNRVQGSAGVPVECPDDARGDAAGSEDAPPERSAGRRRSAHPLVASELLRPRSSAGVDVIVVGVRPYHSPFEREEHKPRVRSSRRDRAAERDRSPCEPVRDRSRDPLPGRPLAVGARRPHRPDAERDPWPHRRARRRRPRRRGARGAAGHARPPVGPRPTEPRDGRRPGPRDRRRFAGRRRRRPRRGGHRASPGSIATSATRPSTRSPPTWRPSSRPFEPDSPAESRDRHRRGDRRRRPPLDGFVSMAPNLGWRDVAARRPRCVPRSDADVPIVVANEADLGALAELRRGAAIGADDVLYRLGRGRRRWRPDHRRPAHDRSGGLRRRDRPHAGQPGRLGLRAAGRPAAGRPRSASGPCSGGRAVPRTAGAPRSRSSSRRRGPAAPEALAALEEVGPLARHRPGRPDQRPQPAADRARRAVRADLPVRRRGHRGGARPARARGSAAARPDRAGDRSASTRRCSARPSSRSSRCSPTRRPGWPAAGTHRERGQPHDGPRWHRPRDGCARRNPRTLNGGGE